MARNELLSRSFMLMNFAAAALLLTTHWQSNSSSSSSSPPTAQPVSAVVGSAEQDAPKPTQLVRRSVATALAPVPEASPSLTPNPPVNQRQHSSPPSQSKVAVAASLTSTPVLQSISPTRLVVDLSDRTVYLYAQNTVEASYPVSIGKPGWETPTGTFQINHMEKNPVWQHPITKQTIPAGVDNPLGTRWIGFAATQQYEIGFHGTNQPATVGLAISHGCLRMREEDIQTLYSSVSLGIPVVVRP
jgi:lipoprotein-anchoring transpeptidase ErfK/SrfK